MRKINKGAAIAGGIFCIIAILLTVFNYVQTFSYHLPNEYYLTNGIISAVTALCALLLAVVLFRSRADAFAGIICLLNILLALYGVFSNVRTLNIGLITGYPVFRNFISVLFLLGHLLKAVAFLLMALQCFSKKSGKNALCVVAAVLAALITILAGICNTSYTYIGPEGSPDYLLWIMRHGSLALRFLGQILSSILGSVYLILAGAAFSRVKDGSAAANDPYAIYKQYQSAQYQAPQYQQPQYQQPQYQAPQYQQPQYQAPQYQQPQYQAPQYQAPQYQQPQYQAPQYQQPQYQAPQYQQPQYQQPQYQAPQDQQPQYQAPGETFQAASQVTAEQEQ